MIWLIMTQNLTDWLTGHILMKLNKHSIIIMHIENFHHVSKEDKQKS